MRITKIVLLIGVVCLVLGTCLGCASKTVRVELDGTTTTEIVEVDVSALTAILDVAIENYPDIADRILAAMEAREIAQSVRALDEAQARLDMLLSTVERLQRMKGK